MCSAVCNAIVTRQGWWNSMVTELLIWEQWVVNRIVVFKSVQCTSVQFTTVHYVFRSFVTLPSFRLKLCSVKYIVQCAMYIIVVFISVQFISLHYTTLHNLSMSHVEVKNCVALFPCYHNPLCSSFVNTHVHVLMGHFLNFLLCWDCGVFLTRSFYDRIKLVLLSKPTYTLDK